MTKTRIKIIRERFPRITEAEQHFAEFSYPEKQPIFEQWTKASNNNGFGHHIGHMHCHAIIQDRIFRVKNSANFLERPKFLLFSRNFEN